MISVSRFQPADLMEIELQPSQALSADLRRSLARAYGEAGNAFTVRDNQGRVIFCGGAIELHPGHAQMWAVFAKNKRMTIFGLRRACRQFIDDLPHRRVDTPVADNPAARRWALALGLREDVRIADAAPDGGDLILFRRID